MTDAGLLDRARRHVREHPPRCLSGVVTRTDTPATRAVGAAFPGDGVLWELCPHDPDQRPTLLGHFMNKRWPPEYDPFRGLILLGPLVVRWEPSGEDVTIFDGHEHGYNPESDLGPVHTTGRSERAVWLNPHGRPAAPTFVACFDYAFWPEALQDGEEATRPQDFFDWFTLFEVDRSTGRVTPVTNYECA